MRGPRRRRPPSDQPKEGSKPLNVPTDNPQVDWMRNRTLHHYPHDVLGRKLGVAAFVIMCVVGLILLVSFFIAGKFAQEWIGGFALLGLILINGFGLFSQVLTGGRCWHGAVAMASGWTWFFIYVIIAKS